MYGKRYPTPTWIPVFRPNAKLVVLPFSLAEGTSPAQALAVPAWKGYTVTVVNVSVNQFTFRAGELTPDASHGNEGVINLRRLLNQGQCADHYTNEP
jgi:hypothetical protein